MSLAGRLGENRATHVFNSKIKVLPSDKRPALITAKRGVTQTSSWWDLICVRQNLFKSFPKTKVLAALDAGWKPIGLLSPVLPPGGTSGTEEGWLLVLRIFQGMAQRAGAGCFAPCPRGSVSP